MDTAALNDFGQDGHARPWNIFAGFRSVNEGLRQQLEVAGRIGIGIIQIAASVKQISASVQEFGIVAQNLRGSAKKLQRPVGQFTVA